jgi:hypothetical protein
MLSGEILGVVLVRSRRQLVAPVKMPHNKAVELTGKKLAPFSPPLTASVAMTSDVKRWQQMFLGFHDFFVLGASEKPEPVRYDG